MVPHPALLTHKATLLYRVGFSCRPISHFDHHAKFPAMPIQIRAFRSFWRHPCSHPLHSSPGVAYKDMGGSAMGFSQPGFGNFRVSAVSEGGSGRTGGYGGSGGGRGGEDSGSGSGDDGGGQNWSLLSWYLDLLAKYPVVVKALSSAILTLIGDLICQIVIDQVPSLDPEKDVSLYFVGFGVSGPNTAFLVLVSEWTGDTIWSIRCILTASTGSVPFFSHVHWSFLSYFGDTRGKAITSCTHASTGVVPCHSCKLAAVDTFPVSQLQICSAAIPGPCC
ncbi:Peroxisomal membrane protein MPV17 [Quillaja saponaria]|uniref:Peroxisomal membrane protein MPV17 n=1 Tax=Quillaja saponaria TaxID=32244 RepID=A0AAD7VI67_QUISA|nr:Peroxisomal membrane protein MPV17 [Quillaja saponaria]